MNTIQQLIAALLVVVVGLQAWTINRQADLKEQMRNLSNQRGQTDHMLRSELNSLQRQLSELAKAERWMEIRRQAVAPAGNCEAADARVEWELLQWAPGTTARLLYRTAADQPWQEAQVDSLGGQNYAARFTLPARTMLHGMVNIQDARPKTGRGATTEMRASDKAAQDRDYQYQILAEGPAGSRSSGVKTMPMPGDFRLPVKVAVRLDEGGRYQVRLVEEKVGQNPCARLEGAELRAYAGDQLIPSTPFARNGQEFQAEWRSERPLTRLEIIIRHASGQETVPVSLPDR